MDWYISPFTISSLQKRISPRNSILEITASFPKGWWRNPWRTSMTVKKAVILFAPVHLHSKVNYLFVSSVIQAKKVNLCLKNSQRVLSLSLYICYSYIHAPVYKIIDCWHVCCLQTTSDVKGFPAVLRLLLRLFNLHVALWIEPSPLDLFRFRLNNFNSSAN